MNSTRDTFGKNEKLCSRKTIAELFKRGNNFFCYPLHVVWIDSPVNIPMPAQVAFSVSKKRFRLATIRNLIKKRIREAYRKNKSDLYRFLISTDRKIVFILIFTGNSIPDYTTIEKSVKEIIKTFIHTLDKPRDKC